MGRPLAKDVLGTRAIGDFTGAKTGTRVEIYDTALRTDGVIIKQRGARTFKCTRVGDIENTNTYAKYILKNGTPSANGEMRLFGYVNTNSGDEINIAKITKRVATDFNDNKYNWILEDDSSNDYIVLTPIA